MKISSLDKFIYFNKRYHFIYLIALLILIIILVLIIVSLKIDIENMNLLNFILNCLKGE